MPYAEKVASPNGNYWRGRYKTADGKYVSVRDEHGDVARFPKKKDAKEAASDKESQVRNERVVVSPGMTFDAWSQIWFKSLRLAPTTMATYKSHLELHILRDFGEKPLNSILGVEVEAWENGLRDDGCSPASISGYRSTLSACLADAVPSLIPYNPAARKRGKGRRSGKKEENRAPERVITGPLGMLLIAERMSILTGRDDEFVMVQTMYADALRLGETIGLERKYARPAALRVEWQLTEVGGKLIRCPPKDDSYGTLDQPRYLAALLADHTAAVPAAPCPCHGHIYVFRGFGSPGVRRPVPLRVLAATAGVSMTAAKSAMSGGDGVSERTRGHVARCALEIGYVHPGPGEPAWHWNRSTFEELFSASASARFPDRGGLPERPVPLAGEWPGRRLHGRNCQGRAEFCWVPVAAGMTPHDSRHSAKTLMEERRIPEVASEKRLRHSIAGISGRYRHVTEGMREEIIAMLEQTWLEALDGRLELSPRSPVAVLDRLLHERSEARRPRLISRNSPETPFEAGNGWSETASDLGQRHHNLSTVHIRK